MAHKVVGGLYGLKIVTGAAARTQLYLSHFLNAVGEDVSDDDPLLRTGPQVHLYQDNVVE